MTELNPAALDRWITGGYDARYTEAPIIGSRWCHDCGELTSFDELADEEYEPDGPEPFDPATDPIECRYCGSDNMHEREKDDDEPTTQETK